ncbi:MAG: hypothetical protein KF752_11825 [Pirellulaceae bacterium]|nr:hypothetical protein [Pirellulaceae bacterium]
MHSGRTADNLCHVLADILKKLLPFPFETSLYIAALFLRAERATMSYDIDDIKRVAHGRWPEILSNVGGIADDYLSGRAGPCPKCSGDDRFRFSNRDGHGSVFCNKCGKGLGDGIDSVSWALGIRQGEAIRRIGDYLGLRGSHRRQGQSSSQAEHGAVRNGIASAAGDGRSAAATKKAKADADFAKIAASIVPIGDGWNHQLVAWWCLKRGKLFTPESLRASGAFVARYSSHRRQFIVLAVPSCSYVCPERGSNTVGYFLYNLKERTLPGRRLEDGSYEQLKVKAVGTGFGVTR